jgi:hypothetical protein
VRAVATTTLLRTDRDITLSYADVNPVSTLTRKALIVTSFHMLTYISALATAQVEGVSDAYRESFGSLEDAQRFFDEAKRAGKVQIRI